MSDGVFYGNKRQKLQLRAQAVGLAVQILGSGAQDRERLERTTQMILEVMVGKGSRIYSQKRMMEG